MKTGITDYTMRLLRLFTGFDSNGLSANSGTIQQPQTRSGVMEAKDTLGQDREYVEFARPIQRKVVQRLVSIIDRLEAEKAELKSQINRFEVELEDLPDDLKAEIEEDKDRYLCLFNDHKRLKAEKAELVEALKLAAYWLFKGDWNSIQFHDSKRQAEEKIKAALAKAEPQ